jgi:glycosyltransferase involved in cell wall biosynthesis
VKILILHSRYRSGPASGENRVVDDEARLLSDAGHEVQVFDPTVGQPGGLDMIRAGLGSIWSRKAASDVERRIDERRPDVVHCHNLFPALSPAVLRTIEGIPIVMTLHNYRFLCLPATLFRDGKICEDCVGRSPWPGVLHDCYQDSKAASAALASSLILHRAIRTFEGIRLFVAISDFVRRKHAEGGFSPDRMVVKPHFTWGVEPREGPGEYFLYLGRLTPEKGLAELIGAWGTMNARMLVVGEGPEASRLRAEAPANVEFRATVQPEEVPALLRGARAVVVPSTWYEGAGRVVQEAYAAGVPVLASRVGGLPEFVEDEVAGLLLPVGEQRAWVRGTERLLDDAESVRMGRAAREIWAARYSPEQGLVNLEDVYRRALG